MAVSKDEFGRKFLNAGIVLLAARRVEITHDDIQRVVQDEFIICNRPREAHNANIWLVQHLVWWI